MYALWQERKAFFKLFLEMPRGIPDVCTFNRAFAIVQPAQLLEVLKSWYGESGKTGGRLLNIEKGRRWMKFKNFIFEERIGGEENGTDGKSVVWGGAYSDKAEGAR